MTNMETGISKAEKGLKAGRKSAKKALDKMDSESADFALVLSSSNYNYGEVIEGVKEESNVTALIGSSTAGEFTEEGVSEGGVAVGLVKTESMKFFTSMGHGISEDVLSAVNDAAEDLPKEVEGYPHMVGINLHEGLAGVGEEVAMAAYQEMGRIPFSGGSAGDNMKFEGTKVFTEDEISEDAVALAVIASEKPFSLAVDHGHKPVSPPFKVTKAKGSTVYELDGKTAIEVWKDQIRRDAKARYDIDIDDVDPEDEEFGRLLTRYEFGLTVEEGNYKVRWPGPTAAKHGDKGPIEFACGIPEGVVLKVVHATDQDEIDSPRKAGLEAIELMNGEPAGAFVFDCICHANILEQDFDKAVEAVADALNTPLVGFETYGEICMREGELSGYHNTTTSILLFPK